MMNNPPILALLGVSIFMSLGALTLSILTKPLKIGAVDTRLIITEQAKKLAKEDPKSQPSALKLRAVADKIESHIAQWGKAHQVTLLAKPAVLSGNLPDYTQMILSSLKDETSEERGQP
jgi:Type-F conjugative transfer system protein (TrbI_Ftype)